MTDSLGDQHTLDPYLNTYSQGMNMPPASGSLSVHQMDPNPPHFDASCDAPLVALHPGMLGPQSPTLYYSYPPTGTYPYPGQQPLPFSNTQDRQPPAPNNVDYAWQALMASIGVQGRPT
jgi:hypothetical protein